MKKIHKSPTGGLTPEGRRYFKRKEGADLKPEPVKDGYHDHGCDMIRYFFINQFPIKNREFKMRAR